MPQQQVTKPPQRGQTAEHERQMRELADRDVARAQRQERRPIVDEATEWLDEIEDALSEWAESDELAQEFVANFLQKGGE